MRTSFSYAMPSSKSDVSNIIRLLEPELGSEFRDSILSWVGNKERPYKLDVWKVFIVQDLATKRDAGVFGFYHHEGDRIGRYWIGWLGVAKEFRRKGFGSMMIRAIEDELSSTPASELWTYTERDNRAALSFFYKNGMRIQGLFSDTQLPQKGATANSVTLMKKVNGTPATPSC